MHALPFLTMLLRIAAGAGLGGIIGYERDRHGRPVGLRTHTIVAMTAATFMVVSSQFAFFQGYEPGGIVEVDSSRIAASVVSGIGFLAGGAILRTGFSVQGLTTAAGLWLVTAIGLCTGAGMYGIAASVTGMGVVALTVLRLFEDKNDKIVRRRVVVTIASQRGDEVQVVIAALTALQIAVTEVEYERRTDPEPQVTATLDVRIPSPVGTPQVITAIEAVEGVRRVHLQPPLA